MQRSISRCPCHPRKKQHRQTPKDTASVLGFPPASPPHPPHPPPPSHPPAMRRNAPQPPPPPASHLPPPASHLRLRPVAPGSGPRRELPERGPALRRGQPLLRAGRRGGGFGFGGGGLRGLAATACGLLSVFFLLGGGGGGETPKLFFWDVNICFHSLSSWTLDLLKVRQFSWQRTSYFIFYFFCRPVQEVSLGLAPLLALLGQKSRVPFFQTHQMCAASDQTVSRWWWWWWWWRGWWWWSKCCRQDVLLSWWSAWCIFGTLLPSLGDTCSIAQYVMNAQSGLPRAGHLRGLKLARQMWLPRIMA